METIIKIDLEQRLANGTPVIIDIGCGQKKKAGRIGIDQVDLPGIDIIADIEQGFAFLPDHSVDEIHCRSVLEHVQNFELILSDMMRILKKGGRAYIFVPHFSNPYYYSDPTHARFFGLYTFYYYVDSDLQIRRKVPNFYSDLRLQIFSQKLIFRAKFGLFRFLRKAFGRVINSCSYFQEYYEEHLVYNVPAHGIEFVIGHPTVQEETEKS